MFSLSRHPKDSAIVEPTEVMEETNALILSIPLHIYVNPMID